METQRDSPKQWHTAVRPSPNCRRGADLYTHIHTHTSRRRSSPTQGYTLLSARRHRCDRQRPGRLAAAAGARIDPRARSAPSGTRPR